jgi:hypothetical protein
MERDQHSNGWLEKFFQVRKTRNHKGTKKSTLFLS